MNTELLERDQRQGEHVTGSWEVPADSTESAIKIEIDLDTLDFLLTKRLAFRLEVWDSTTKSWDVVTEAVWQGPSLPEDSKPSLSANAIPLRGKRVHVVTDTTDRLNMGVAIELQ